MPSLAERIRPKTLEEVVVPSEEPSDDPAEEIVAMPEEDDDGKIDYGDLSNWAYWETFSDNSHRQPPSAGIVGLMVINFPVVASNR